MHNLEDLIQDIYKDEALPIPGTLSSEQKKNISDKVLEEIEETYFCQKVNQTANVLFIPDTTCTHNKEG